MSRISELLSLATPDLADLLALVDVSDTTQAPSGSTKQITLAAFFTDIPRVVARAGALVTVASSTAETDVLNVTIPAGIMDTNRCARLTLLGDRRNSSGATEAAATLRVYVGGVLRYQDPLIVMATNAATAPLLLRLYCAMQNTATTMLLTGHYGLGAAGAATTGIGDAATDEILANTVIGSNGTFTLDTTVGWNLRVTIQHGTNNANVVTRRHYAVVEVV